MSQELTIQILGHNGADHLARAVEALRKIPKGEVVIRYIDNGSSDASVTVIRNALPEADIVERGANTGYAAGHNFGFSLCTTPYVLVHDQDVVIEWSGIKELLKSFEDEKVGAVQGKMYRNTSPQPSPNLGEGKKVFDSAGIIQTLSLNGVDRGANEEDRGQFDAPAQILAAMGGCALLRMEALQTISPPFDADFFAYKEDVDLGWRLNRAGWKVLYKPVVMGWHARTLGKRGVGGWGLNPRTIFERLKSPRTRMSLRNYCWLIVKNASAGNLLLHSPFILLRLKIFFWLSVLYPPLFSVWKEIWQGMPRMLAKRS